MRATSHSYYSLNYDRSYSQGMTNLAKMKKYDAMKKVSTLKRGEKIMSIGEASIALSRSFNNLESVLKSSKKDRKMDPTALMMRTTKRNKLLVDKLMDQSRSGSISGFTTWR